MNIFREEKILADVKDLTAFIKKGANENRSLRYVEKFSQIENFLLPILEERKNFPHKRIE